MATTTPPSVITTTNPMVGDRSHTACGVVAAERILIIIVSRLLTGEGSGEKALQDIRTQAEALGADAIVDVNINHEKFRGLPGVMMVMVSGNAVKLEQTRVQARVARRRARPV